MVSKTQRRANIMAIDHTLYEIRQAGAEVGVLSPLSHQYRVTGPKGRKVDFYGSTLAWVGVGKFGRDQKAPKGKGMASLLSYLAKEPAKPKPAKPAKVPKVDKGLKPTVTIFADASYDHKTGAAGWGGWMVADDIRSFSAGGKLETAAGSHDAEIKALANAMVVAKLKGYLKPEAVVMLQSDCLSALQGIRKVVGALNVPIEGGVSVGPAGKIVHGQAALDVIAKLKAELSLTLIVRHVPGHQEGEGRAWVNRHVDKIAKNGMRERRRELAGAAA